MATEWSGVVLDLVVAGLIVTVATTYFLSWRKFYNEARWTDFVTAHPELGG